MSVSPSSLRDLSPLVSDSAHYESLRILINGMEVRIETLLDFQIDYDDIIRGSLIIKDTDNIIEFSPLTFSIIELELIDSVGFTTKLDFIILDVNSIRSKDNIINVIIKFEELNCNTLSLLYSGKSFKDKTMLQMLETITKEEGIEIEYFHLETDYKYPYFVIPNNISLLEFITLQSKYSNIRMVSDRNGLYILSKDYLDFKDLEKLSEPDFSLKRDETLPYWNIMEYQGKINQFKNTQRAVQANKSNTVIQDLKYSPTPINIETVYKTQKLNNAFGMGPDFTLIDSMVTVGTKEISHIFHNEIIGDDEDYRDIINAQQELRFTVQGTGIARKYTKLNINLIRAIGIQTAVSDEVFSGTYVVTKVVDKIMGATFLQYITIQSSDYGPGSNIIK